MSEITLEKIDLIRERTNVTYGEAKEALEICDGNVVDALIYIEKSKKDFSQEEATTKEEFLQWIKDVIAKGNVTRIKIRKDDKVIFDIPVTAGFAGATVIGMLSPWLLGIGFALAVVTQLTVEIIKEDGSVEVVNKVIKTTTNDVKEKMGDVVEEVKQKVKDNTCNIKNSFTKDKGDNKEENVYRYTVTFDDIDENK